MNLLLTSIGKRVELIEHLKSRFRVIGVDASVENPAKDFADAFYQIPKCREEGYVEGLLEICRKERVSLLVPLYEPEFDILAAARERFEEIGVLLLLSEKSVLDICDDKRKTAAFFEKHDIPAPGTFSPEEVEDMISGKETVYPLVIKPADGMGSANIFIVRDKEELAFFSRYVKNALVQECLFGREYTIDVLCDFWGEPVYIVPRIRLEVRDGEVTKSRVDLQKSVMEETRRLLAALRREGGVKGPLTIQCFVSEGTDSIHFLEINPRFGGGVPLAFAAGADYASALFKMSGQLDTWKGSKEPGKSEKWDPAEFQDREIKELTMLRYTQAVYRE